MSCPRSKLPEDFKPLVEAFCFEPVLMLRSAIARKGRGHTAGAANVMRGIIVRRAFYAYVRQICTQSSVSMENFGWCQWSHEVYGMTETGQLGVVLRHKRSHCAGTTD